VTFQEAFQPIRALSAAFGLIGRCPGAIILGGLFAMIAEILSSTMFVGLDPTSFYGVEFACLFLVLGFAGVLLSGLALPGLATAVERALVQGEERMADLVEPRGRWLATTVVTFATVVLQTLVWFPSALVFQVALSFADNGNWIGGFAVGLGGLLLVLPVTLYLSFGLMLGPYAAAFERLAPHAAVARGWKLMKGNRLRFLLWQLFWLVFVLLGLCLCFVGIFATAALATLATAEAYLRVIRQDHASWAAAGGAGAPLVSAPSAPDAEADW
jgi:hypothetical protein